MTYVISSVPLEEEKTIENRYDIQRRKVDESDSQARHGRVEQRSVPLSKEEIEASYSQVHISICFVKMDIMMFGLFLRKQ